MTFLGEFLPKLSFTAATNIGTDLPMEIIVKPK